MTEPDDLAAFRAEVREFLRDNLPPELARAGRRATSVFSHPDHSIPWQKILTARGWGAIDWPVEYGGTGWTPMQKYIFSAECARAGAPNLLPQGLKMVARCTIPPNSERARRLSRTTRPRSFGRRRI